MRQRERRSAFTAHLAIPGTNMIQKFCCGFRPGSFGESSGEKFSAVIIGTGGENFPPRFRVGGLEIMPVRKLLDFLGCQAGKKLAGQIAQERVAQTVYPFKMFEKKNQTLEVRHFELAVNAVKRMRDGVADRFTLEIRLQIENVFAKFCDFGVM